MCTFSILYISGLNVSIVKKAGSQKVYTSSQRPSSLILWNRFPSCIFCKFMCFSFICSMVHCWIEIWIKLWILIWIKTPTPKFGPHIYLGCLSVIAFLYGLELEQKVRDFIICSNERSRCICVPFDRFDLIRPPEMAEFGQNTQKLWTFETWAYTKYSIPLRIGGGWGLIVFHKYILVIHSYANIPRRFRRLKKCVKMMCWFG